MTEIRGEPKGEIEEKRVKLNGVVILSDCSKCRRLVKKDLGRDGLDHPVMNKPFDLDLYCSECEHEWSVKVVLSVSLGPAGSKKIGAKAVKATSEGLGRHVVARKIAASIVDSLKGGMPKQWMETFGLDDDELVTQAMQDVAGWLERGRDVVDPLAALEARILRRVATALKSHYEEAYHSMGGPQDGDSHPSQFHALNAARELERGAEELEQSLGVRETS